MSGAPQDSSVEKPLRIRRGRVDSVDIFEIKDTELDALERGSPTDLYFDMALVLISTAFSLLTGLCTVVSYKYALVETVFIFVMVIGFILGGILLILWHRGKTDRKQVVATIRNRMPPEAIAPSNSNPPTPSAPITDDSEEGPPVG